MGEVWGFHRPAGDVGCSAVPLSLHSEGRPVRLRKDGLPTVHLSDIKFYLMQKDGRPSERLRRCSTP